MPMRMTIAAQGAPMTAINTTNEVYAGTQADLERDGRLLTKVGSLPASAGTMSACGQR